MNGLKVRPCCIEVLEQVLKILKKHVSDDETETELLSSFKCDTQPTPVSPPKPVSSQLHYNAQNKSSSSSGQSGSSVGNNNPSSMATIRSPNSKNTLPLGFHLESRPQQTLTLNTPSLPQTVRNRIPAQSRPIPQHSPPQSMVVVTNSPTKPSNQTLKVRIPSPSAASTYRQSQPSQTLSDNTIMHLLREESSSRNKFLFDNQVSGSNRKVLALPKNMEGNKQKEVELVAGSGVKIPESELNQMQFNATSANDPAVLVIALLQHFFSDEVLAKSTATSCRGKGRAKHSTAHPLNQQIMQAIRQFSTSFSQIINRSITETQVNRITANKIGTAKMALKRRQEEHSLGLHSPSQNKLKRHSTVTSTVNNEELLNYSDEQLNFIIKVERDEFNQPLT